MCNSSFSAPRKKYCGGCVLELECPKCNRKFQTKRFTYAYDGMCCSRLCQVSLQHKKIECEYHGFQKSNLSGMCMLCHNDKINIEISCIKHGKIKSFAGSCIYCYNESEYNRELISKRNIENWKDPVYAAKIAANLGDKLRINWLYESPECQLHPIEDKQALRSYKYECWSCLKRELRERDLCINIPGSFFQLTYRASTDNSSGQFMMEEELIEQDISWFAYIKGYIKEGVWTPLVVGKTGSRLVNKFGTDISFKYSGEQLGRTFLREKRLEWDISKILIIPCNSEKKALLLESYIASENKLFFS